MNILKRKNGFTLTEITIVVILIAILSAASIPYYKNYLERQKVALAISSLRMFADSAERYMSLHNEQLPSRLSLLDLDIESDKFDNDGSSYNDGNFTFQIENNHFVADRNTGEYVLSYSLGDDAKLSCTPEEYCSNVLNITSSED